MNLTYTTLIEAAELRILMQRTRPILVDCRFSLSDTKQGERSYLEGHLPGARYAHLEGHLSGAIVAGSTGRHPLPRVDRLRQFVSGIGISPTSQVVAYDEGGAFAARFWWLLRWLGHEKVAVLNGALNSWLEAGGELTGQAPEAVDATPYPARRSISRSVTAEDILKGSAGQLVDAREPVRFRGEAEPLDSRAGRLPGAVNRPFSENFSAPGYYRTRDALSSLYADLAHNEGVTCYCGSGVTAATSVLAMVYAGLAEPALYSGSFSDWITDPAREVVTG